MSTFHFIVGLDTALNLEADYFVSQLKSRWADSEIHSIDDESAHDEFQWLIDNEDLHILGDFSPGGIAFQAHGDHDFSQFVLWFRRIAPSEQHLIYYIDSLNKAFEVTSEMTEAEIIAAFHRRSDDAIEKFIDRMPR